MGDLRSPAGNGRPTFKCICRIWYGPGADGLVTHVSPRSGKVSVSPTPCGRLFLRSWAVASEPSDIWKGPHSMARYAA